MTFGHDVFQRGFAAEVFQVVAGEGQTGGQANNDFQDVGSSSIYSSPCQALKAWRNCEISTSELKTAVLELHNDAPAWNDNDWEDYMLRDGFLIPNNRNQEATVGEWSEWSDCGPNVDGEGKQNRTREIVKHKIANCVEDKLGHGFSLIEFRDCELLPDEPDYEPIYGCMDENATNYDPDAEVGDNSCKYEGNDEEENINPLFIVAGLAIIGSMIL